MRWHDVLDEWRKSEEEVCKSLYRSRGFASWLTWRLTDIGGLGLERRAWKEETVPDPHLNVRSFAIGGYRGWKKYRPADKPVSTFDDIAMVPAPGEVAYDGSPRVDVSTHPIVLSLLGNLRDTTILGLRCGDLTVVLDGTQRCAAIVLESMLVNHSAFRLTMRSAEFAPAERHLLEDFCRDRHLAIGRR
jgi:hypothetical protein